MTGNNKNPDIVIVLYYQRIIYNDSCWYNIATSILICMQLSWQLDTEIQRTCVQFHEQEFVLMPTHCLQQEQLHRWGHMRLLGMLYLEESSLWFHYECPS